MRDIRVIDFINNHNIKLNLEASNKLSMLKELTHVAKHEIEDVDKFLDDLISREFSGSTALEHGLAIPHVRSDYVKEFLIVVGTKKDGINADSIDDEPSKLFFLIATNSKYNDYHLQALAQLTKILPDKQSVDKVANANTKEELIKTLRELEQLQG